MEIERAIERLASCSIIPFDDDAEEVCNLAIQALRKQIPTKPIVKSYSPALCPCCKTELSESVGDGYYKHLASKKVCDCGQKLDWWGVYGD